MMIRINLLPVRQVQKREQGRQFIVLMVGTLIIAGAANAFWYVNTDDQRAQAQRRLDDTMASIAALDKTIGEVSKLERRKQEVQEKLGVLDKLINQRAGPVKVLDAISQSIPKKVWLTNYEEKGGSAGMTGYADSLDDVSEFMRALNSVVWTPKGMARILERKRDGAVRVEIASDLSQDEFPKGQATQFFQGIELKQSSQQSGNADTAKSVLFEVTFTVQLAI